MRLATSLHQEKILFPLWSGALRQDLHVRSTLVMLNYLIDVVPNSLVPEDLLDRLLEDLTSSDGVGSVRGTVITKLLGRAREGLQGAEADRAMLRPLLPKLLTDNGEEVVVMSRYLLPPLAAKYPDIVETLLGMLDENSSAGMEDECFAAWLMVAAFGVQNGSVLPTLLDQEKLQEALYHDSDRLRIMAFELVSASKDLLEDDTLDYLKEAFHWNEGLPQAG